MTGDRDPNQLPLPSRQFGGVLSCSRKTKIDVPRSGASSSRGLPQRSALGVYCRNRAKPPRTVIQTHPLHRLFLGFELRESVRRWHTFTRASFPTIKRLKNASRAIRRDELNAHFTVLLPCLDSRTLNGNAHVLLFRSGFQPSWEG